MQLYDRLTSAIRRTVIPQYQADSTLRFFPSEKIGDVSMDRWIFQYLADDTDASLTTSGFNPSDMTLAPEKASFEVFTAAQRIQLDETQTRFFKNSGHLPVGIEMLAKNVIRQANHYLWQGTALIGTTRTAAPVAQYNYLYDPGTANGTALRPLHSGDNATAGVWSTSTNMTTDVATLVSELIKTGSDLADIIVFYPRTAHLSLAKVVNTTTDRAPFGYLNMLGIPNERIVPIADELLYTAAGAAPTASLFDLVAIDRTKIVIGYTRPEQFRVVPPLGTDRNTTIEAEVWFCPLKIPIPFNEGGTQKYYSGISRIKAIADSE